MRLATCTPVDFDSDEHFFGRDSGLLCRGLQAAGAEARVIMPGEESSDDADDLVRCKFSELCSIDWWKGQGLDGVVLYAWGDPAYIEVARAIRQAGISLIQSLDTAGLPSPYADLEEWWCWRSSMAALPVSLKNRIRPLIRATIDLLPFVYERKRLDMLAESDRLAVVSPSAFESIRRYLLGLRRPDLIDRLLLVPHPVLPGMRYNGEEKSNQVLVVGRWEKEDHAQKNPQLTLEVLERFLSARPDWTAEVIGRSSDRHLAPLARNWSPEVRRRLTLTNRLTHSDLMGRYRTSRILLCGSRFESFHIASAEAVCSGCSVVVGKHPLLGSTAWFTTEASGTLGESVDCDSLTSALMCEASAWDDGGRSADFIASTWQSRVHAPEIGRGVRESFSSLRGRS